MGRHNTTAESLKEYFSTGVAKKRWADAQAKANEATGYGEYDDGKYTAQLIDVKVARSEGSGRLQVVLSFKFTEGEYAGKTIRQYQGIEDQGIEFFLKTLKVLGYGDISPEEMEDEVFPKLKKKKPVVKLRLKTKEGSEYQNVYVLGLLDAKENEEEKEDDVDNAEDTDTEESVETTEKSSDTDDDSGEEESADADSDNDDDEEEEEKPKKPAKKPVAEDDDEDEEAEEEPAEDKAKIDVGTKLVVRVDGKSIKSEIIKIMEERKDGTGTIKVQSLKTGKKYVVDVPADVIDIIDEE